MYIKLTKRWSARVGHARSSTADGWVGLRVVGGRKRSGEEMTPLCGENINETSDKIRSRK